MTIRKQIFRTFAFFAIIVSILIGSIYFVIYSRNDIKSVDGQLDEIVNVSSRQMSDVIWQMNLASQILLSDQDVLQAIRILRNYDETQDNYENLYFSDAYTTIRVGINTYFDFKNYYRVIFFNRNGVVIAGSSAIGGTVDASVTYADLEWIDHVLEGKSVLLPCHIDDWGRKKVDVISLVKGIAGDNMGYIEVQWLKSELDRYMEPEIEGCNVLFYNLDGELLYSYEEEEDLDYFPYVEENGFENIHLTVYKNGSTSKKFSLKNGIRCVSHLDRENEIIAVAIFPMDVWARITSMIPILLLIVLSFLGAGMAYVFISSRVISKPIVMLSEIIEDTNLNNLAEFTPPAESSMPKGEEMGKLYRAYFQSIERLSSSIEKEKQFSLLQLEAQFGMLQAQVDPHFLYNILNVISAKGIMANDESICDICAALGRMLRYSTNTKTDKATIREEEEYLHSYLQLMKYRYEDKLEYEISIPEDMKKIVLPKVTLEQIVENCFRYEADEKQETIRISVIGSSDEKSWNICIRDNGVGFNDETRNEIYEKMDQAQRSLTEERQYIPMEIGGMGLINVYARLYLTFSDALIFTIDLVDEGASVTIGAEYRREDESDV